MPPTLLSLHNVYKTFGGLLAVQDIGFEVIRDTVVGVIGPNGAGKTTVFNLITGSIKPDSGKVIFLKKPITGLKPHSIVNKGIARTFQTIRLFSKLTVLENVLSGCHTRMEAGLVASILRLPSQRREERKFIDRAMDELEFVGLESKWQHPADSLAYGDQRRLEIARALASDPQLLILDEPAGGMNEQETIKLGDLIRKIKKRKITVMLIEHDMSFVMDVCDKVVVMEGGLKIAEGSPMEIQKNQRVIEAYLGVDDENGY
ncbi:MAG: ABC transporter ATP-binding protein [Deltaproteobacteria bacterium]|jgi:branched-chain amino acid transport system ATP-binding protein|nr:ABC transporter ATP-binding protein [Deltaproteobacteria bacterium]